MIVLPASMGFIGTGAAAFPFMAWNPADSGAGGTFSNGNRTVTQDVGVGGYRTTRATHPMPDGGYVEVVLNVSGSSPFQIIGLCNSAQSLTNYVGNGTDGWSYYQDTGVKTHNAVNTAFGASYAANDVIGIALKGGKVWFAKNNVWQGGGDPAANTGEAFSGLTGTLYVACSRYSPNSRFTIRPSTATQAYSPPTGFFAPSS